MLQEYAKREEVGTRKVAADFMHRDGFHGFLLEVGCECAVSRD